MSEEGTPERGQEIIEEVAEAKETEGAVPGGKLTHPAQATFYTEIGAFPVMTSAHMDLQALPMQEMEQTPEGTRVKEVMHGYVRFHVGTQSSVSVYYFDADQAIKWGQRFLDAGNKLKLLVLPGQEPAGDLKKLIVPRPGLV